MRTNLHPNYTAKLPKNSESWRVNAIYQTSKEICGFSPRALNGWRLITKPNAGRAGLGIQKRNKIRDRHGYSRGMRQTVARGTRYLPAMFNTKSNIGSSYETIFNGRTSGERCSTRQRAL